MLDGQEQSANTEKPKEIKIYKLRLFSSLAIGAFLSAGGIWSLFFDSKDKIFLSGLAVLFGVMSLILAGKMWLGFPRNILFVKKQSISLKNGEEIAFAEPDCPYELWIFCEVPFSYYNGFIHVAISGGESHTINVPNRNKWWWKLLWPKESNCFPIIWRPSKKKSADKGCCSMKFNLSPSFSDTVFADAIPTHDTELMTIFVRSV